jgi:GNAT superfamily N-acetyltransferase
VFLAYVTLDGEERLAGFFSILPLLSRGPKRRGWWRGHRTVVLPDYQGLGIGNRMVEIGAEQLWRREGKRYAAVTSSPAIVHHRRRRPDVWTCTERPSMKSPRSDPGPYGRTSAGRLTTSWVYVPEELRV